MKPLVIYHADCTDGFGAAFAAWMKLGDGAEYLPMNYGQVKNANDIPCVKGREVYILDFSFERGIMETLMILANKVVWLDHHKTAFEVWCGAVPRSGYWRRNSGESSTPALPTNAVVHLDDNKSGALLAWEYFHPGTEVPLLIQHIDDRDRWQFKIEGSSELHAALSSYKPWSFEQWRFLLRETHTPNGGSTKYLTDFKARGSAILRAQGQHVKSMTKQARRCELHIYDPGHDAWQRAENGPAKFSGLAVNASIHQSEVGHELANQSGTYGLVWHLDAEGKVRCSLRSNGDYDVSAIAKSFGGGGHRNAAGFETDITTLMGWLK